MRAVIELFELITVFALTFAVLVGGPFLFGWLIAQALR